MAVRLLALRVGRALFPINISWDSFLLEGESTSRLRLEGLGRLKTSKHNIGTRTRDLPACNIAPQPTMLPHREYTKIIETETILTVQTSRKFNRGMMDGNVSTELSPSWEATSCAVTPERPSILWNSKVHYRVHWSLSAARTIQPVPPHHTYIILPTTCLDLLSGLFSYWLSQQ
jgi:hypothetical protein